MRTPLTVCLRLCVLWSTLCIQPRISRGAPSSTEVQLPLFDTEGLPLNPKQEDPLPTLPKELIEKIFQLRDADHIQHITSIPVYPNTLATLREQLSEEEKASLHAHAPHTWLQLHHDLIFASAGQAALRNQEMPHPERFFALLQRTRQQTHHQLTLKLQSVEDWVLHGYTLLTLRSLTLQIVDDYPRYGPAAHARHQLTREVFLPLVQLHLPELPAHPQINQLLHRLRNYPGTQAQVAQLTHTLHLHRADTSGEKYKRVAQLMWQSMRQTPSIGFICGVNCTNTLLNRPFNHILFDFGMSAFWVFYYLEYQYQQVEPRLKAETQHKIFKSKMRELVTLTHLHDPTSYAQIYATLRHYLDNMPTNAQLFRNPRMFQHCIGQLRRAQNQHTQPYLSDLILDLEEVRQQVEDQLGKAL
ncbi:MAG: hypothetical protein OXT67_05110 [Zetaproteobacteria bacterium]|nr:hypothetical protein [Zetaproteobacteria bacterium]